LELFGSSAEGFREVIRTYAKGSGEAATFVNQPFLKDLQQFIITDLGSHMLDVVRLLFGEATSLYCQTQRIHKDIKGEDVATIVLKSGDATDVLCQMAYAGNYLERERFPETFIRPSLQITGLTQSVFAGKLIIPLANSRAACAQCIQQSSLRVCFQQSRLTDRPNWLVPMGTFWSRGRSNS